MLQQGDLTVSGDSFIRIVLPKRPRHVNAYFIGHADSTTCSPHHDKLKFFVEVVDEDIRHHYDPIHYHHDREFFLFIEWNVSGVRDIHWIVSY